MRIRDAVAMLASGELENLPPGTWADLGCGTGTFTEALAMILPPRSRIYAMDADQAALERVPSRHGQVTIQRVAGDFTRVPWPFEDLDGLLMANSLHYVEDQPAFIKSCLRQLKGRWRFVIVEYNTTRATSWVPYPVDRSRLVELFTAAGDVSTTFLGTRQSLYQRAALYAAVVMPSRGKRP